MNAAQLLLVLLGVVLTFVIGSYFVGYMGWLGILPAGILGFATGYCGVDFHALRSNELFNRCDSARAVLGVEH